MLTHLHIRNYALISHLDIDFHDGFSVMTGETGAGKSIILGALNLVMGARADIKSITEGEERINLIFDVAVPVGTPEKKITEDLNELKKAIRAKDSRYAAVIAVDTYVP